MQGSVRVRRVRRDYRRGTGRALWAQSVDVSLDQAATRARLVNVRSFFGGVRHSGFL